MCRKCKKKFSLDHQTRTGEFGAGGGIGVSFDDISGRPQIVGIRALRIRHRFQIDSLQAEYILVNGSILVAEEHGLEQEGDQETYIVFSAGEVITEVRGLTDSFILNLTIFTTDTANNIRQYGPYGVTDITPFSIQEGNINGFYGTSGSVLDSIGVYFDGLL